MENVKSMCQSCPQHVETWWNDFAGMALAALCKLGDFGILDSVE